MMLEVPRSCETMTVSSKSSAASMASAVSAAWVPASWGQGVVPARGEELVSYGGSSAAGTTTGDDTGVVGSSSSVIYDFDEEMPSWDEAMEPFDAERFVDRLVEDEPPSWRGGAAGSAGKVWEAARNSNGSSSANLFLWPSQQPLLDGYGASNHHHHHHQQHQQQTQDVPMIVPHDPILDALFTPCRVMPAENSQPAVTRFGLVRVASAFGPGAEKGGPGGAGKKGITGFEPVPIYNIPPPAEAYTSSLQVPMAPLRQPSGGRFGVGLYSPDSIARSTSNKTAVIQSAKRFATYLNENSSNIPGEFGGPAAAGTAAAATPAPLTGADAHSSQEYDDERHAFLRKQEAAVFAQPTHPSGRALTPAQRAAAVDWLSGLHAAAPAASGGAGEPLSLETLFLAVNLMDRFLCTEGGVGVVCDGGGGEGPGRELKLAAAACLALASKYQDTQAATLWGLAVASISGTSSTPPPPPLHLGGGGGADGGVGGGVGFDGNNGGGGGDGDVFGMLGAGDGEVRAARKELVAMEMRVASALGFRLTVPSAVSFLGVFLRRAGALGYLRADGPSFERVREEAQQILLCVLRDASSLEHPPSALAAAALYWASCIAAPGAAPPTSFAFLAVTGYELEQLCRCLRDMEGVRTGGGGGGGVRHGLGSRSSSSSSPSYSSSGAGFGGGDFLFGGAAFPEHAGQSLFGAGGGHPAIAAL